MKLFSKALCCLFILVSCKPYQKISGKYKLGAKDVYMTIELNQNKTFVQYISTDLCSGKYYYGFYEIKKRKIVLTPLDATVNIISKSDVAIYSYEPQLKGKEIHIRLNESIEASDAKISINDSLYGETNRDGIFRIDSIDSIKSIKINSFSFEPRYFKIDSNVNFNRVFFMINDFGIIRSCTDFYLQKRFFIVNKNKLKIIPKKHLKNVPDFYMLR